jgi:hypothetical protein
MGTRGRTSSAELTVIAGNGVETVRRPDPPAELSDEQAAEWTAIVSRMPADWFPRETHGLLAQYCRHVVAARRIAQLVAAMEADDDGFDLGAYDKALKMQEREGRAISSLATRMRLTQQTTYDKSKKKPAASGKRPWD